MVAFNFWFCNLRNRALFCAITQHSRKVLDYVIFHAEDELWKCSFLQSPTSSRAPLSGLSLFWLTSATWYFMDRRPNLTSVQFNIGNLWRFWANSFKQLLLAEYSCQPCLLIILVDVFTPTVCASSGSPLFYRLWGLVYFKILDGSKHFIAGSTG